MGIPSAKIRCFPADVSDRISSWISPYLNKRRGNTQTCFSFSWPKNHSINLLNFSGIKQIDYIFPCTCTVIDHIQKTSQRVKKNSHGTRLRLVSYFFVLYTLWRHPWCITVHMRYGKCNLFVKYKCILQTFLMMYHHSLQWISIYHVRISESPAFQI